MESPSFWIVLPVTIVVIAGFFLTGFLKNLDEKRKFRDFLDSQERDPDVQKKLKDERIETGKNTGRPAIKTHFKDGNPDFGPEVLL